jgi:hypothetical protein
MRSKILVIGMGGLSCEVCKNLILAGVGCVTLMDHEAVRAFVSVCLRPGRARCNCWLISLCMRLY